MASTPKFDDYPNMNTLEISTNSSDEEINDIDIENDMTEEQYREYFAAVAKSEGFDVPYYPNTVVPGITAPILNLDRRKEELNHFGGLAIKQYNEQNGTNFEIVEFVKVNTAVAAGLLYYMTFKAKPSGTLADSSTMTFQARVFAGIEETEVDFCREVPSG